MRCDISPSGSLQRLPAPRAPRAIAHAGKLRTPAGPVARLSANPVHASVNDARGGAHRGRPPPRAPRAMARAGKLRTPAGPVARLSANPVHASVNDAGGRRNGPAPALSGDPRRGETLRSERRAQASRLR